MAYTKHVWEDNAGMVINAGRLNNIEGGIEAAHKALDEMEIPDVPAVDPTLAQSGAAADAAVVGEKVAQLSEEIAKKDKPLVYIDGEIPTTKDNVLAEMRVVSSWLSFHAYIKIKCQGSSSMNYDKKNFTVTLYQDEARTIPLYITIPGWNHASNKFVFKANYVDHSHARNIIAARLWAEVVASRPDYDALPEEYRNSPNNGAIDGFSIIVYTNGSYQGLYTWNIGKDAWLWGMNEDNPNHILLCAETNTNNEVEDTPCNFRALWGGVNEVDWSVEVGENSETVKTNLNNLISCVKDTDDDTFKATIGTYINIPSVIDYWLHQYVICGLDGLAKNMLLGTYVGNRYLMGAYDMDSTFGLWWTGGSFVDSGYRCPEDYQEKRNLLFERVNALCGAEVRDRYTELRKTVYSYGNIMSKFEAFMGAIGKDVYEDDLVPYPDIPSADTNNIWQIRNFVRDRLAYCDSRILRDDSAVTIVDYIESDGESWIDTGVKPDSDMIVECGIYNPEQEMNYENYFGTYGNDFSFSHTAGSPTTWVGVMVNGTDYTNKYYPNGGFNAGTTHALMLDLSLTGETDWASTDSLWLFAKRNASKAAPDVPGTFRLSYAKLTRKSTGEVLLDLHPAVDNSGFPGMYDSVSKKMLYNAGTGTFAVPTA